MPASVMRAAGCGLHAYGCEMKWLLHQTLRSNRGSYCTLETAGCITSTTAFGKASCRFQKKKSRTMTSPPGSGLNSSKATWRLANCSAAAASLRAPVAHVQVPPVCLSGTRECPLLLRACDHGTPISPVLGLRLPGHRFLSPLLRPLPKALLRWPLCAGPPGRFSYLRASSFLNGPGLDHWPPPLAVKGICTRYSLMYCVKCNVRKNTNGRRNKQK